MSGSGSTVLARVRRSTQAPPASEKATRGALLPWECVKSFLTTHPLILGYVPVNEDDTDGGDAQSPAKRVHLWIVELASADASHPSRRRAACVPEMNAQAHLARRAPLSCRSCSAVLIVLDEHKGEHICLQCGLVQQRASINVVPEWVTHPSVERSRSGGKRKAIGFDAKANQRALKMGSDTVSSSHYWKVVDEVEEMNQFSCLTKDDVRKVALMATNWIHGTTSCPFRASKIVACMIFWELKDHILDEARVRDLVKRRKSLPAVDPSPPAPTFACEACGRRLYSRRDARFHCKGRL